MGYSPLGHRELDTTEHAHTRFLFTGKQTRFCPLTALHRISSTNPAVTLQAAEHASSRPRARDLPEKPSSSHLHLSCRWSSPDPVSNLPRFVQLVRPGSRTSSGLRHSSSRSTTHD